jgi:hypothetical protein
MPLLAIAVFAVIAFAGWRARERGKSWRQIMGAALMPPVLLLGCVAIGFGLHFIAASISGASDPSFAHPWALRLSLAFGVWAVALLGSRLGGGASACWLWLAGLGVVQSIGLPGFSPFFVFPSVIAAITLPFRARLGRIALALPALAGLIVWLGLAVQGEEILGLGTHPLFTVATGFALISLLPLLPLLPQRHGRACLYSLGLAIIAAVIAGFLPPYSVTQPQRLNLRYVEADGRAQWAADPVRHFPPALRQAGNFAATPQAVPGFGNFYLAPAGNAKFPAPSAEVLRAGSQVSLRLHGSPEADGMMLSIPADAGLVFASVGEWKLAPHPQGRFVVTCATAECRDLPVTMRFTSAAPVTLELAELRLGLPAGGEKLQRARGNMAVASQIGDSMLLLTELKVPGR